MITITSPLIQYKGDQTYLVSTIIDSQLDKSYDLWYSVENQYGKYLCYEVADAFLLAILQLAMVSHQDIKVEAPISSTFLFNLKNAIIPMLKYVIPKSSTIAIEAESIDDLYFEPKAVGCGCSLGIDSFSSLLKHLEKDLPVGHKVTHLALFNSGQHGDLNLEGAEIAFYDNVRRLEPFAKEIGLPIVAVNSNLNIPYRDYNFSLMQRFVQTTISAVFCLQKLFKRYVYASGYPTYDFKFSPNDVAYCESALVPLLKTQNVEVILSNPMMTRVEKTAYISDNRFALKYLDVCWSSQITNMTKDSTLLMNKVKINCGKCGKCLRTLLTFEILGCLNEYSEIFDLVEYKKYRLKFIIKVLSYHKTDAFLSEIYDLIKEYKYKVPIKAILYSYGVRLGLYRLAQKIFGITTMAK